MARLFFYTVLCALAVYVYRTFRRQSFKAVHKPRREQRVPRARHRATLVRDAKTGEYRVERD